MSMIKQKANAWLAGRIATLVLCCGVCMPADVIQIMNLTDSIPGGGTYQTATSKITGFTTLANGTGLSSIGDGTLTVSFSDTETKGKVPATFATWGSPPDTESSTPAILNSFRQPDPAVRTLSFSIPITVFGVEVEGESFSTDDFTMDFFSGSNLVGSVARDNIGDEGARILAGYSFTPFTSVVITDEMAESFAIAQVRYSAAALPTPEPGTTVLLLPGIAIMAGLLIAVPRYRKRKEAEQAAACSSR